jgi:hypothetical protein
MVAGARAELPFFWPTVYCPSLEVESEKSPPYLPTIKKKDKSPYHFVPLVRSTAPLPLSDPATAVLNKNGDGDGGSLGAQPPTLDALNLVVEALDSAPPRFPLAVAAHALGHFRVGGSGSHHRHR